MRPVKLAPFHSRAVQDHGVQLWLQYKLFENHCREIHAVHVGFQNEYTEVTHTGEEGWLRDGEWMRGLGEHLGTIATAADMQ
jgi:hypothetical protein